MKSKSHEKIYALTLFITSISISFGQITFQKTFGDGNWAQGNSVKQTIDGGYIVAGTGNGYSYLIKTNIIGDTLWMKHYERGGFLSAQQSTDGGFIMCGYKERLGLVMMRQHCYHFFNSKPSAQSNYQFKHNHYYGKSEWRYISMVESY